MELLSFQRLVQSAAFSLFLVSCGGGGGSAPVQPIGMASIQDVFDGTPPGEPLQAQQWHLWAQGVNVPAYGDQFEHTGQDVTVAMLDTAIQIRHPELQGRISSFADFIEGDTDPSPPLGSTSAWHGTAVAGLIAAAARGPTYQSVGEGGRGVTPLAQLIAFRVVPDDATSMSGHLAEALVSATQQGARVVNDSWTHQDNGKFTDVDLDWLETLDAVMLRATPPVVVFAAGNGGDGSDATAAPMSGSMSNWDTYTNSRHVIAVGATNALGEAVAYSESGSNVLVSAPGGEPGAGMVTTDLMGADGLNPLSDYMGGDTGSQGFVGTSGAAATTSGVIALMLQTNANLGPRDVAWILADTADSVACKDAVCGDWLASQSAALGSSKQYSPRYGFGRINATAAVARAQSFALLGPELRCTSGTRFPGQGVQQGLLVADGSGAVVDALPYAGFLSSGCSIKSIERVEVWVEVDADNPSAYNRARYAGDLNVALRSPSGGVSWLTRAHQCAGVGSSYDCGGMYGSWTDAAGVIHKGFKFSSVRHMGESLTEGAWEIDVSDTVQGTQAIFKSWELVLYGH